MYTLYVYKLMYVYIYIHMYSGVCTCMCVSCHDRAQPPVFVIVLAVPAVDLFYLSPFGKMWDGNIAKRMEVTSHMKHVCFFVMVLARSNLLILIHLHHRHFDLSHFVLGMCNVPRLQIAEYQSLYNSHSK